MNSTSFIIATSTFRDIIDSPIKPSDWIPYLMLLTMAAIIAFFLGRYRHIGILWSWFFLFFLNFFGIPIILFSGNYFDLPGFTRSKKTEIVGWILTTLFALAICYLLISGNMTYILLAIGFCGFGIYLIQRGKGRIPNEPSKSDISARDFAIRKLIESNLKQKNNINERNKIIESILDLLKTWVYCKNRKIQNIRYLVLSTSVGFILGWYYKIPNSKFLMGLTQADSLWRKNIVVELQKKESSFFSTDLFSFNWLVFFCTTIICFLFLLFFTDEKFRQNLYEKITFSKEKEAI